MLTPDQKKALDYSSHTSLTANAGSGKTFVLKKRYLDIALNENIPLRNMAAITFTDKAAGELYNKIAQEIDERLKSVQEKPLIERLERIRRQLVSANLSTIHSFCLDILREHPVEAGIDANFTPIDEIFTDELIELSVEEVIKSSLISSEDREGLKKLIRFFSSKQILSRELAASLKYRRNILNLVSTLYSKTVIEIAHEFFQTFLTFSSKILNDSISIFIKEAEIINSTVLNNSPNNTAALEIKNIISRIREPQNVADQISLLVELNDKMLTKGGTVAVRGYLEQESKKQLHSECQFVEKYLKKLSYFTIPSNHNEIEIELASFGKMFLSFFNKSLEVFTQKKKEGGYLDYEDILLFTQKILENEEVKKSLTEKFSYIMIDEYQDSNELQYNIFLPILDYLKRGNLFVVGDEKQSIYMFRDAELEVFNKTKFEITQKAGKDRLFSLPDSFRMAPNLCLFINSLFRKLFENPNSLFNEVEHSDLVCAREDGINGSVELLLAKAAEGEGDEIAEANLVAERILRLVDSSDNESKVKWGNIAILCRKRKSFIELEKTFVKKNIPCTIVGGKGFYQRQSIYDIFNYFSFFLDQNDDTALVGILRSPFFLITDSEIFEISLRDEANFWLKLKSFGKGKSHIEKVVNLIQENIELIDKTEIPILLRKIITETGYLSVLSSRPNAIQEHANINKLINLTINFFNEGFRTLYDYLSFLRDAINEVEDESQAVISEEDNSVKIMTIHQAKGLEFPIVFLYRCGETSGKTFVKSKSVLVNKEFGLLTKVPLEENYFNEYHSAPIVRISDYISERKNTAELKRLFYVGITRAINQLFISASLGSSSSIKEDTFIELLQEGLNIDFEAEKFNLKSKLKLLSKTADKFVGTEKEFEIQIPIINYLEPYELSKEKSLPTVKIKSYLTNRIDDLPFGEIISATQLSVYKQCPLKYHLIYQLGFSPLMLETCNWIETTEKLNKSTQFDFSLSQDENISNINEEDNRNKRSMLSRLKGTLIHKLLSDEVDESKLELKTEIRLKNITLNNELNSTHLQALKSEIVSDLTKFYHSQNYYHLKSFQEYENECEIYCQHLDFYLFGIIDKLIIDKNKILIIDYKTDSISSDEISERAEHYFLQLKFYAYILHKKFTQISEFRLQIIFISHPNEFVSSIVKPRDFIQIQIEIEDMVKMIRLNNYEKNLHHCKNCIFSVDNNCIVT